MWEAYNGERGGLVLLLSKNKVRHSNKIRMNKYSTLIFTTMSKGVFLLCGALIFMFVLIVGCSSDSSDSVVTSSNNQNPSTSPQNSQVSYYNIGNSVSDSQKKITIEQVTFQDAPTYMAATGYQMAINYSVKNLQTSSPLSLDGSFAIFDSNGNSYHASYTNFNSQDILPGEVRRGRDLVNVPKTATGFNIRYKLSDGRIVIFNV